MRLFSCLLTLLITGCGSSQIVAPPPDAINRGLDTIQLTDLKTHLELIAGPTFEGRGTGESGGEKAVVWLEDHLKALGLTPGGDNGTYRQKFSSSVNVIGILEGQDPTLKGEWVLIGAHYDHLGKSGSSIYFGADDNGSGTVATMEIAEALTRVSLLTKRTVVVAFFGAEEDGMVGSGAYVKKPNLPLNKLIYMLNLDMVGYVRNKSISFLGASSNTYVSALIRAKAPNYPNLSPSLTSSSGGGSDHVPFKNAGVGVTFIHSGTHNNYHTTRDTADKVNYEGLTDTTKLAFEVLFDLSYNPEKPKREAEPFTRVSTGDHGDLKWGEVRE